VVGDAIDVAPLGRAPLQSALDRFERGRVGIGLGGAAAGAAVGTLIVPGIGTAIGAFLGVFAGFLKGLDSLKSECVTRLDSCLEDVERSVSAQIVGREASFAEAIRASLDEAFDRAVERLEESIARLMALERRVLDAERKRRDDLAKLRALLDEHASRFASLS
jgi:phage-related tail protein